MRITQTRWRVAGGVLIVLSGAMAFLGVRWDALLVFLRQSLLYFVVYWSLFALFLLSAVYIALLDLRYIRLLYAAGKREVFRQTFGDLSFRKALREAYKKHQEEEQSHRRN